MTRRDDDKMIYPLPVMGYLSGRPQKIIARFSGPLGSGGPGWQKEGVVLGNPKTTMQNCSGAYDLHQTLIHTIEHGDDATFIAGSLLQ